MDLNIDRMLLSEENGLIIDYNTLFLDNIDRAIWPIYNSEAVKELVTREEYLLHPYIPMYDLSKLDRSIYYRALYKIDAAIDFEKSLADPRSPDYIDPYAIREDYMLTDFGLNLKNKADTNSKIKWKIIKERGNPFTMPGYESNTFEGDIYNFKKIYKFIEDNQITGIFLHTPELFMYLMEETDLGNVTFLYTSFPENCINYYGTRAFKYIEKKMTIPESRKIELINVEPYTKIDRFFESFIQEDEDEQK